MNSAEKTFGIGCDVEFHCRSLDGTIIFPQVNKANGYEIFTDYALSEMRTKKPSYNREELLKTTNLFRKWALRNKAFQVLMTDIVEFDMSQWDTLPMEQKTLGCNPDQNIYDINTYPDIYLDIPKRSCGGHIHIGIQNSSPKFQEYTRVFPRELTVKNMDLLVGLSNTIWNHRKAPERRAIYGTPGTYRPKSYGVEYRVLDNSWMMSGPLTDLTFYLTKIAFSYALKRVEVADSQHSIAAVSAIMQDDHEQALEIFTEIVDRLDIVPLKKRIALQMVHAELLKNPVTGYTVSSNNKQWESLL